MLSLGLSCGFKVVGRVAFLLLFLRGDEENISGLIGPKSVSGGSLSKGDEGVFSNCLDSVSKQIFAFKYRWRGLAGFSVRYSEVTEGEGSGGIFHPQLQIQVPL